MADLSKDRKFKTEKLVEYFTSKKRIDVTDLNYSSAIKLDKMISIYYSEMNPLGKYLKFKELYSSANSFLNEYKMLKNNDECLTIIDYLRNYVRVIGEFATEMENSITSDKEKEYKRYNNNGFIDDYKYAYGFIMLYINYQDSPYLQDYLNSVGLSENDFNRFVNIIYELNDDLYEKYLEKSKENKKSRICEVISKMDNIHTVLMNKDGETDRIEFYRNLPFVDMNSSNEIINDLKLKKMPTFDQRFKSLLELFYPEDYREMTKKLYDEQLISKDFKKISESEIENTNYIVNDVVVTKEMKDEIVNYMKKENLPFFVLVFNSVRDKYLKEGLNEGKKLVK